MAQSPQNLSNHVRLDPLFHFVLLPVFAINFINSIVVLVRAPGWQTAWNVVLAIAFIVAVLKIRTYALKVQDRVIRLEERQRLSQVLPEPLRSRICELTEGNLVALRFVPDAELPTLVQRALAGAKGGEIKKEIKNWRPDYFRV